MHLRNINDQCAAYQSKINKKAEELLILYTYKVFLDDLRPKEVKDREAAQRAEKLEQKRLRRQAQSMEPTDQPRRGTRTDPSRSIAAQGRAANQAHSQADPEENHTASLEVEISPKLRPLFDEDSSNDSYDLPFSTPEELHEHFVELEENSLSLIQQWQENEQ